MASFPCKDDPSEVLASIYSVIAKQKALEEELDKLNKFINGGLLEEVQLGDGEPTPTLRNLSHLVKSAAATLDGSDVSGKLSDAANGGETLRMLSDRFGDVVNVKDFGALGDGAADDTEAFEDALEAAGESASVFVPKGVYSADAVDLDRLVGDGAIRWPSGKQISIRNIGLADRLCQTFWGEAYSGYNATIQDCSICRNDVDGKTYLFMCQQRTGTAYTSDVVHVVTQYEMPDEALAAPDVLTPYTASSLRPVAQCQLTGKLGHGEGVYAVCRNGQFYLYGQACHKYAQDGETIEERAATGFTKTTWRGSSTTEADVQTFYGVQGVQNAGQIALSPDGTKLIVCSSLDTYSGDVGETWYWDSSSANMVTVHDLAALESAASDSAREGIQPLASYVFGRQTGNVVRSGIATDGRFIYILSSSSAVAGDETLSVYSYNGDLVKNIRFDAIGDVVSEAFMHGVASGGDLYFPYQKEVEGAALLNDTLHMVAKLHFAKMPSSGARYCTYLGRTFIALQDSQGTLPTDTGSWAPTLHEFADAQPWSASTEYTGLASGGDVKLHYRYIAGISPSGVYAHEFPLGQVRWSTPQIYDCTTSGNVLTLLSKGGSSISFGTLYYNVGSMVPFARLTQGGNFYLYDATRQLENPDLPFYTGNIQYHRTRDATDYKGGTSHYGKTAFIRCGKIDTREDEAGGITFFTGDADSGSAIRRLYIVPDAGTIRVYDDLRPATDNESSIGSGSLWWKKGYFRALEVNGCVNMGYDSQYFVRPLVDGATSLGTASKRWIAVYAADGSINTSDARLKTGIDAPSEALMRAWGKVSFNVFQFKDAVEKKGSEHARIHVGCIAQEIADAFASEGLDASRYGLFCYDEWEDEWEDVEVVDQEEVVAPDGTTAQERITHMERRLATPAGNVYSLRYEECLALECAYQRWRLDRLEAQMRGGSNEADS